MSNPICIQDDVNTKPQSRYKSKALEQKSKTKPGICKRLQLRFLRLGSEVRHEEIAKLGSSLAKVVAHTLSAETLADDVEVKAGRDY